MGSGGINGTRSLLKGEIRLLRVTRDTELTLGVITDVNGNLNYTTYDVLTACPVPTRPQTDRNRPDGVSENSTAHL